MVTWNAAGWCAGKNVFPSLMHAGMQLSVVGVGLPGLTGCTLLGIVVMVLVTLSVFLSFAVIQLACLFDVWIGNIIVLLRIVLTFFRYFMFALYTLFILWFKSSLISADFLLFKLMPVLVKVLSVFGWVC